MIDLHTLYNAQGWDPYAWVFNAEEDKSHGRHNQREVFDARVLTRGSSYICSLFDARALCMATIIVS